jgi:hypothetical protein
MRLLQAVRNQAARIASRLEDSNLFTNMGDRGTFREGIISDFLRPFLPECYGLNAGEVFSADGTQSAQVDIVLYDAMFSTALFRDADKMLFPAESVFGSIEVKSHLNGPELRIAIDNIASLKRLPRVDSDMMDLLPFLHLDVGGGLGYDPAKRNPYLGFVFGYNGISPESVAGELNQRLSANPAAKQQLPDFVFVARPGYMVARVHFENGQTNVQGPGREFSNYMYVKTAEDTLPLFYIGLNVCLGQIRLRSVNFLSLWQQLFSQVIDRARSGP